MPSTSTVHSLCMGTFRLLCPLQMLEDLAEDERWVVHLWKLPMIWKAPLKFNPPSVCVLSRVSLFATPWTVAHQAPLSMGSFRQEYWSGLPYPFPGDVANPGTEPAFLTSSALAGSFFTTSKYHLRRPRTQGQSRALRPAQDVFLSQG